MSDKNDAKKQAHWSFDLLGSGAAPDIRYPGVLPLDLEEGGEFDSLGAALCKAHEVTPKSAREDGSYGVLDHPFNFEVAINLRRANPHLSSCLDALRNAVVGQGLEDEALHDKLDKVAQGHWDGVMESVVDDLLATGIGFLEIVREGNSGSPEAIYWLPAQTMFVETVQRQIVSQDDFGNEVITEVGGPGYHFVQNGGSLTTSSDGVGAPVQTNPRFALYGHKDALFEQEEFKEQKIQTEVVVFTLSTNLWEYYGAPRHLSAVPYIELVTEAMQQRFDFFHNRGVPDFLLFLRGMSMDEDQINRLRSSMNAGSGRGSKGKSAMFISPEGEEGTAIDLLKLGVEYDIDKGIVDLHDMSAMAICSATRMPPVLAGVSLSGKMGAANETTQALILLEVLQAKQLRNGITKTLATTLGKDMAGGKFKYKSLIEEVMELMSNPAMMAMDTMSKQRGEAANNQGRDLSQGTKTNGNGGTKK